MLNIMVKNKNKKEVIKMDMYQKRKMRQEKKNNDNQESFSKVSISCLSCIYGDYHLNLYKMGVFKN